MNRSFQPTSPLQRWICVAAAVLTMLATAPRQVWSWDITELKGPGKWTCFHLYVILDIFSRYVVGWMIALREAAELAEQLIAETVAKQGIEPKTLTLHADRGTSMRSKSMAQLLVDLEIAKTHGRPHVSDDDPYSEAQFKTLKYRPDFPERFGCIEDARACCERFFHWYNTTHRHGGIGFMTPEMVHYGRAAEMQQLRIAALDAAFLRHPLRFKGVPPQPPELPTAAWINPPKKEQAPTTTTDSWTAISCNSVSQSQVIDTFRLEVQILRLGSVVSEAAAVRRWSASSKLPAAGGERRFAAPRTSRRSSQRPGRGIRARADRAVAPMCTPCASLL